MKTYLETDEKIKSFLKIKHNNIINLAKSVNHFCEEAHKGLNENQMNHTINEDLLEKNEEQLITKKIIYEYSENQLNEKCKEVEKRINEISIEIHTEQEKNSSIKSEIDQLLLDIEQYERKNNDFEQSLDEAIRDQNNKHKRLQENLNRLDNEFLNITKKLKEIEVGYHNEVVETEQQLKNLDKL